MAEYNFDTQVFIFIFDFISNFLCTTIEEWIC